MPCRPNLSDCSNPLFCRVFFTRTGTHFARKRSSYRISHDVHCPPARRLEQALRRRSVGCARRRRRHVAGDAVEAMIESLRLHDPEAQVLPYLLSGGTDNKALSRLGITGYGFVPLRLPANLDFPGMFHGVDERVPLEALDFGHRVLTDLLRRY